MAKKDGSLHDSESTLPGQLSVNTPIFDQARTEMNLYGFPEIGNLER